MIFTRKDLIVTRTNVMVPAHVTTLSTPNRLMLVSGDSQCVADFEALQADTLLAFNKQRYTTAQAKDVYARLYKQWADFRRKYRHCWFAFVNSQHEITHVDIDNLYLNKKSVNAGKLMWSSGVEVHSTSALDGWVTIAPRDWKVLPIDTSCKIKNNVRKLASMLVG